MARASERRVWSVHKVVQRADEVLREKARPLWVRGEVSGWKRYPSGHCYFTLKDEHAEICCVIWAGAARLLPAMPADGMEVDVYGQIRIYPRRGRFQLDVSRIEATGVGGLWRVAMERLVAQLRGEGLLDEARKRPLPVYPERIGIATSATSAALQDMLRALRRKAWWMHTVVSHCSVEGAAAAPEIASAIRRFGSSRESCLVDVVIVARGGGSVESLWAYNTEPVARAILACPVPVISAVGHETDYTVADMVADVRAATPTAGAERAVPDGRQVLSVLTDFPRAARIGVERAGQRWTQELLHRQAEMDRAMTRRLGTLRLQIDGLARHIEIRSPRQVLVRASEQMRRVTEELHTGMRRRLRSLEAQAEMATQDMERAIVHRLEALDHDLTAALRHLHARSPRRALERARSDASRLVELLHAAMQRRVGFLAQDLERGVAALEKAAGQRVSELELRLVALLEALEARSPLRVLSRGYAVVSDRTSGRLIRAAEEVQPEQRLLIRFASGEVPVRVEAEARPQELQSP